jgi:hypothetical protein
MDTTQTLSVLKRLGAIISTLSVACLYISDGDHQTTIRSRLTVAKRLLAQLAVIAAGAEYADHQATPDWEAELAQLEADAAANDSAAKVIAADAATRNDPLNALTL